MNEAPEMVARASYLNWCVMIAVLTDTTQLRGRVVVLGRDHIILWTDSVSVVVMFEDISRASLL